MRRVVRLDLSSESAQGLEREQARADARRADRALNVEAEWRRARRNKPLREACDTLRAMAGNRERCMYCGDAHGSDIDHFWPKASYPERMFRWPNMLICCAECGRIKGTQFPLADGQAILIDPTVDDPWRFLDFDPQTGNIVPRYDPERGAYMLRGEQTVAILQFDRREAMARGYQRTYRRITRRVEEALAQQHPDAADLLHDLGEADDHGLLGWCFDGLGRHVAPFDELQARHPAVWVLCRQGYRQF